MECIRCDRSLPGDGRFLTCTSCRSSYHLGKQCSGVAESTFSGMGATRRECWKCLTCRTGEARSGAGACGGVSRDSFSDAGGSSQDPLSLTSVGNQLALMNSAIQQLLPLKSSVESLLPLSAKMDQLLTLQPAVEELRNTVAGLQSTVDSFSTRYDAVLALATANEESVKDLQKDVQDVMAAMDEQSQEISRLKEELNTSQQYSRRCNMEIHGLPYCPGEDLSKITEDLAQKLSISSFKSCDIAAIHRLPQKRDSLSPVLIQFVSVTSKEAWMAARGRLQRLSQSENQTRLFFNDNLTQRNKELFWLARNKGKDLGYKFVWLKNSKIYARKSEGSPVVRINAVKDLEKLT